MKRRRWNRILAILLAAALTAGMLSGWKPASVVQADEAGAVVQEGADESAEEALVTEAAAPGETEQGSDAEKPDAEAADEVKAPEAPEAEETNTEAPNKEAQNTEVQDKEEQNAAVLEDVEDAIVKDAATVTVTFVPNGADGDPDAVTQEATAVEAFQLQANSFAKEGYSLAGWNTEENGSGHFYKDGEEVTLTEDLTLYAQWVSGIQIGTGNDQYPYLPFYGYYNYGYSEQIYTAEEIGDWNILTEISFCVKAATEGKTIEIYLADTDLDYFESANQFIPLSDAELVYSGEAPFDSTGWHAFPFSSVFVHDSERNLCVIVVNTTGHYASGLGFAADSMANTVSLYNFQDNARLEPNADAKSTSKRNAIRLNGSKENLQKVTLTYSANDGSAEPQTLGKNAYAGYNTRIAENPFTESTKAFRAWNTKADGSGEEYLPGDIVQPESNMTFYAQWYDDVLIGNPYTAEYNNYYMPFYNGSSNFITQQILFAGEIGNYNLIDRISFFREKKAEVAIGEYRIYMKDIEGNLDEKPADFEDAVLVYEGRVSDLGTGWTDLELDQVFMHDPDMNICLFIVGKNCSANNSIFGFAVNSTSFLSRYAGLKADDATSGVQYSSASNRCVLRLHGTNVTDTIKVTYDNGVAGEAYEQTAPAGLPFRLMESLFLEEQFYQESWNTKADGTGETFNLETNVSFTEDTVLFPVWKPCPTVTFYANTEEAAEPVTQYLLPGEAEELMTPEFTNGEMHIAGFNTKPDGTGWAYGISDSVVLAADQSLSLYAVWSSVAIEPLITITFSQGDDMFFDVFNLNYDESTWKYNTDQQIEDHTTGETGTNNAVYSRSVSDSGKAVTPDDLLVIRGIQVPEGEADYALSFWARGEAVNGENFRECFAVYVIDQDSYSEDEINYFGFDNAGWTKLSGDKITGSEFRQYVYSLEEYAGQAVSVAIRHYNCTGQNMLILDDVSFLSGGDISNLEFTYVEEKEPTEEEDGNIGHWLGSNGKHYQKEEDGSYSLLTGNEWVIPKLVPYVNEEGNTQLVSAIPLTGTETTLNEGFYIAEQDISFDHNIELRGEVNLILADGKTMEVCPVESSSNADAPLRNVRGRTALSKIRSAAIYAKQSSIIPKRELSLNAIDVGNTAAFHIYGQEEQTGNLYVEKYGSYSVNVPVMGVYGGNLTIDDHTMTSIYSRNFVLWNGNVCIHNEGTVDRGIYFEAPALYESPEEDIVGAYAKYAYGIGSNYMSICGGHLQVEARVGVSSEYAEFLGGSVILDCEDESLHTSALVLDWTDGKEEYFLNGDVTVSGTIYFDNAFTDGDDFYMEGEFGGADIDLSSADLRPYWPFTDVTIKPGNWVYEGVRYMLRKGIMTGDADADGDGYTTFRPKDNISRYEFVVTLYRLAGEPELGDDAESPFVDVKKKADGSKPYYYDAVLWAADNGITTGKKTVGEDVYFMGKELITRQEIAVMMMRLADYMEMDTAERADLADAMFTDGNTVSKFAKDGMSWAVAEGLITGKDNGDGTFKLDPKANAQRREVAAILQRYLEYFSGAEGENQEEAPGEE